MRQQPKPSPDAQRLATKILANMTRERELISDLQIRGVCRAIPEDYIRADALEVHRRKVDQLKEDFEQAFAKLKGNATPGPRLLRLRERWEEAEREWTKVKRVCEAGEEIHRLRQERAAMVLASIPW